MRRLHPPPTELLPDLDALYRVYRPPAEEDAHLRINMVTSLDGHVADGDGVSGSLGGDGDLAAFRVMRHLADAILVGAGTVRAENYGGMVIRDELRGLRAADGRGSPAPIVVVTSSGDLDPDSRLFAADVAPVVLTCATSPEDRLTPLREAGARVVVAGEDTVDLATGLRVLREQHGLRQILCEGGPQLNAALMAAGLVDELCLTLAPSIVGSEDPRRMIAGLTDRAEVTLRAVLEHEGDLLLRYAVGSPPGPSSSS